MTLIFKDVSFSFKEYSQLCMRLLAKRSPLKILIYSVIMLVGLLHLFLLASSPELRADVLAGHALSSPMMAFFALLVPFSFWQNFRRMYRSNKFLQAPATYILSEEGVQVTSPLVSSQASWQTVDKLYLLGSYAVLMNTSVTGYFFKLQNLEPPAASADLQELVARHGIGVK